MCVRAHTYAHVHTGRRAQVCAGVCVTAGARWQVRDVSVITEFCQEWLNELAAIEARKDAQ